MTQYSQAGGGGGGSAGEKLPAGVVPRTNAEALNFLANSRDGQMIAAATLRNIGLENSLGPRDTWPSKRTQLARSKKLRDENSRREYLQRTGG
jgi:hypothetical protein